MKSHIKNAFGVVQAKGKRQLDPGSCRTRLPDFNTALSLLTYLNATEALLRARQNTSLAMGNMGARCLSPASLKRCTQDRPYRLRYHDSNAVAKELKSMEESRKCTHISI